MATVLPFHRLVVSDPAFAATDADGFTVHTRWIETEWDNTVAAVRRRRGGRRGRARGRRVVVEVGGRRLEVSLPGDLALGGGGGAGPRPKARRAGGAAARAPRRRPVTRSPRRCRARSSRSRSSDGDTVAAGDLIVVLEAMKMENPVTAHKAGTVTGLAAAPGSSVAQGTVLCEIKD